MDDKRLIQTGIRGLDEILLGGIRQGNIPLVESLQRKNLTAVLTREIPASETARSAAFAHEQFIRNCT